MTVADTQAANDTFTFDGPPRTPAPASARTLRPSQIPVTSLATMPQMVGYRYGAPGYVAQLLGRTTPDGEQLLRDPDPIPYLVENGQYLTYVYRDMLNKDGKLGGLWDKLVRFVTSLPWAIAAPKDATPQEETRAAAIETIVRAIPNFRSHRKMLLLGEWQGRQGLETTWEADATGAGTWGVAALTDVGPHELFFDRRGRPFYAPQPLAPVTPFDPGRLVLLRRDSTRLNPYGFGRAKRVYFPYWLKREGGVKAWAYFNEKYGAPTVKGGYKPEAGAVSEEDLATFEANLGALLQNPVLAYDMEKFEVEFMEAMRAGTVNTYRDFIDLLNGEMAQGITGETLSSTTAPRGNMSAARLHGDVLLGAVQDLAASEAEAWTTGLVEWIDYYNFGTPEKGRYCRFAIDAEDPGDKLEMASLFAAYQGMGGTVGKRQAEKALGIEPMDDNDIPLVPTGVAPPAGMAGGGAASDELGGMANFRAGGRPVRFTRDLAAQNADREAIVARGAASLSRVLQSYREALLAEELPPGKA